MPTLEKPKALDSMVDNGDKDIYREYVKSYPNYNRALTRSSNNLYSLVLGQCAESLRLKFKGKEEWKKIDEKSRPNRASENDKGNRV